MATAKSEELPWHAAFPAPKSTVATISRSDFLESIKEGKKAGKDFILVDLRRNDHEV
jgi:arsenical-resistance protein 2